MRLSKYVAIGLLLAACGASQTPLEQSCERFLTSLRASKAAGVSCEVAKARAQAEEPSCKAVFVCNLAGKDAGHE